MAKTYYKYAKRETSPVDYAGAAKGLSEGLMATVTGLEKKAEKAAGEVAAAKSKIEEEFAKEEERKRKEDEAIEKQYGDKVSKAADLPLSYQEDYKSVQSVILDLSADAADLRTKLKRDYDAGNMTTKEYNRRVNNIRDQFKMMKQTAVTSLDMVNATNEAMQNGTALPIQHDMLTRILKGRFDSANAQYNIDGEGNIFANITDPETGKVEQMSVYDMNKLSMQRFDVFDIDGQAESLVKDIGQVLENYRTSGKTTEDLLKMEIMQRGNEISTPMDYVKKNINGYSDNQLASILQMKMSQDYKRSMNPADFGNDDVVVYTISPLSGQYEAKLTDNQKQAARDFATAAVLTQLNPLKKPDTTGKAPSSAQMAKGKRVDIDKERINDWLKFYTGDDATKERILSANSEVIAKTVGAGTSPVDINVVGDVISVSYDKEEKDGTKKTITKDITIPKDDFIGFLSTSGRKLLGDDFIQYLDEALEISDYTGTEKYNPLDVSYKTQVKVEESKKQDLGGAKGQAVLLLAAKNEIGKVPTGLFTFSSTTYNEYENAIKNALTGIKGLSVTVDDDGVLTMSVEGLGSAPTIQLDQETSTKQTVINAISNLMKNVEAGESLGGTTEPPSPDGNKLSYTDWKSQNPNGTFAEYNQYKSQ